MSVFFSDKDKIKCFEELMKIYYNKNFGHASKSEIDLLMFHFYLERMVDENNKNGVLDYNACSDYRISKDLGITQQRVRNLKVKKQLVHPIAFDWQQSLSKLLQHARYDERSKKIRINIPDPNLYYEIQNHIEEQGGYIEIQLNSKILQIRIEYFLALAISLEDEENRGKIKKLLEKQIRESSGPESKHIAYLERENMGKALLKMGVNITEVAANMSSLFSNVVGKALMEFITENVISS